MRWRALALASLLVVPSPFSLISANPQPQAPPCLAPSLARQPSKAEIIESNFPAVWRERPPRQERLRFSGSGIADAGWSNGFGLPSIDGYLNCVAHFGNDIVVGGSFTRIGGIPLNNIARWDLRILVHDVHGRVVNTLDAGFKPAGNYSVRWDGRDWLGNLVSSGIYFVTIRDQSGTIASRKIVRLR